MAQSRLSVPVLQDNPAELIADIKAGFDAASNTCERLLACLPKGGASAQIAADDLQAWMSLLAAAIDQLTVA
jgi:hypothetical protein